jgi:TfoX/Sxy family transcriptional regulator of competence genes
MTEEKETTWRKAPEALVEEFAAGIAALPGVQARKMFGYPCAFFNGNMFAGLYADELFLRLAAADREELLARPGAHVLEPMTGRPMREYVVAPQEMIAAAGGAGWRSWLDKALAYAASLPPKEAKPAKKKAK